MLQAYGLWGLGLPCKAGLGVYDLGQDSGFMNAEAPQSL